MCYSRNDYELTYRFIPGVPLSKAIGAAVVRGHRGVVRAGWCDSHSGGRRLHVTRRVSIISGYWAERGVRRLRGVCSSAQSSMFRRRAWTEKALLSNYSHDYAINTLFPQPPSHFSLQPWS